MVMVLFLIVDFASKQTHGNCQNPVTVECDGELRSLSKHLCQGGKLAELCSSSPSSSSSSPSPPLLFPPSPPHWLLLPGTRWPPACSTSSTTLEKAGPATRGSERLRSGLETSAADWSRAGTQGRAGNHMAAAAAADCQIMAADDLKGIIGTD